jgi:hypothetical protein
MKTIPYKLSQQVSVHPRIRAARKLCDIFRRSNFSAYWVGGAVRDMLIQPDRVPKDIDIATDAPFDEICKLLPKTRAIGRAFGVGLTTEGEFNFEIATFRKEGEYTDRRHPSLVEQGTLKEDSERRDFTVNALYFDPLDELLLDLHDGLQDLHSGLLRCVGDANSRLHEDPLRIVRLFRFSANLNFKIEPTTLQAAIQLAPELHFISKERVLLEVSKISNGSEGRFADLIPPLQPVLLGKVLPDSKNDSAGNRRVCLTPPPFAAASNAGILFAVLCAANEGFANRNWMQTFDGWPLSSEERAAVELFQRTGEGQFLIPQTSSETDWRKFLENYKWLRRQSTVRLGIAEWLFRIFGSEDGSGQKSARDLLSGLKSLLNSDKVDLSVSDCLERAIGQRAKPLREKIQSLLADSSRKSALGWARVMADCSLLLGALNLKPANFPDFMHADDDKKIASLCETATRWSESKAKEKK